MGRIQHNDAMMIIVCEPAVIDIDATVANNNQTDWCWCSFR